MTSQWRVAARAIVPNRSGRESSGCDGSHPRYAAATFTAIRSGSPDVLEAEGPQDPPDVRGALGAEAVGVLERVDELRWRGLHLGGGRLRRADIRVVGQQLVTEASTSSDVPSPVTIPALLQPHVASGWR
jgi:hypothetical protein